MLSSRIFGVCGVPFQCHYSRAHFDLKLNAGVVAKSAWAVEYINNIFTEE